MWRKTVGERQDLLLAFAFLALVILAEVALMFGSFSAGLVIHILTLFCLISVASIVYSWTPELSRLLVALTLVPLIRIFSLSTPYWPFADTLVWLAVISVPMLAAAVATIYVQKLKRSDYGFVLGPLKHLPIQAGIVLLGIPLGLLEYFILRPDAWISDAALGTVIFGALAIILGTGVAEELIFRGIILYDSSTVMGWPRSIVYVSLLFAAMHVGFLSVVDLLFVFLVGLFFAYSVYKTRTLVGVIGCHSLLNIVLYLAAPFIF
ncbi:MAG: lysostaphin resistance A-like protein [Thermoplasmata archaeon]